MRKLTFGRVVSMNCIIEKMLIKLVYYLSVARFDVLEVMARALSFLYERSRRFEIFRVV